MKRMLLSAALCALLTLGLYAAQAPTSTARSPEVPRLLKYSGSVATVPGAPRAGAVGVVFAIYAEPTGGAPLWVETQNVQLDGQGRYSVNLGAVRALPNSIFATNEARWLGVQVLADSEPEQPRVMLVSVPYAMKAQDAETLGGRPASAYLLAESIAALPGSGKGGKTTSSAAALEIDGNVVTVDPHTVNAIPKFTATDTLDDSLMFETYNQAAFDAFGLPIAGNEDVVNIGDGTGLRKRLNVTGRVTAEAFDISTSTLANSFRVVNDHPDARAMQANARDGGNGFTTGLFASAKSNNALAITAFAFEPDVPNAVDEYSYGVFSVNYNPQGAGVLAWSAYNGAFGDDFPLLSGPMGLYAAVAHSTGIAAVLDYRNTGTAKLLSARMNGTEVASLNTAGNFTTSGSITAASFSGDGSALTNVTGVGSLASDPSPCGSNNFVTDIAADGTLTCAQPSVANLSDGGTLATTTYVDSADTALAAPQYVTLAASSTLANERVLTAGTGIALTDGGAGAAVTVSAKADSAQAPSSDSLSSIPSGGADFATTYTIPANTIAQGTVIEVWAAGVHTTDASGMSFGYSVQLGSTNTTSSSDVGVFQAANVTGGIWTLNARIVCTSLSGSTATLVGFATQASNSSATNWGTRAYSASGVTVDASTALTLAIREMVNSNGSDSTTLQQLVVKILK